MPRHLIIALSASIAIGLIAITAESLWIDELMSAFLAMADNFGAYKERTAMLNTSDIQMPFYMFYIYLWENLLGHGERILRLANLPWFVFGVTSLWHLLRHSPRLQLTTITIFLVSPFAWYYLNEVRPYAMQLGASCATHLIKMMVSERVL